MAILKKSERQFPLIKASVVITAPASMDDDEAEALAERLESGLENLLITVGESIKLRFNVTKLDYRIEIY